MLTELTKLEAAVVAAIRTRLGDEDRALEDELRSAKAAKRENTGHGFYTDFSLYADKHPDWSRYIHGPTANMIGLGDQLTMGFILWCHGQAPVTLEGFQYFDANGDTADLTTRRLEDLAFSRLEW